MSINVPLSLRDLRVDTITSIAERGRENEAIFHWPLGMTLTPDGDLLVANYLGHNIRLIDSKGVVTTYAGTGRQGFLNGPKEAATFSGPSSILLTPLGDLLVTDVLNNCLRKVAKDGTVTIFAGTGQQGFRNGPKEQATFFYPFGLVRTSQGHILVLDKGNHSVRLIYADTGMVTTFVGCGVAGCKDGPKETAMLNTPYGLCLVPERSDRAKASMRASSISGGRAGLSGSLGIGVNPLELYLADSGNHRIVHIAPSGNVSTMAGVPGVAGYLDGAKDVAKFDGPRSILLTPHGDLLVSDQGNHRIRIVETNGLVSTFAGCGRAGLVDGIKERASFSSPSELCLTSSGDLYISDFTNNKIRHIKCPMWDVTNNQRASNASNFTLEALLEESCPTGLSDFVISMPNGERNRLSITVKSSTSNSSVLPDITTTAVGSGACRTWYLHKIVILARCHSLLQESVLEKARQTSFSAEAVDALVRYIYCDELPDLSLHHLCDLDFLLNICEMHPLSTHVRWIIDQRLTEVSHVEVYIDLLGHVARNCGSSTVLVDLILLRLRRSRAAVADNMQSVFAALSHDQELLIQVMAKLMRKIARTTTPETFCTYSALTNNLNECAHFGYIADQICRLFETRIANPQISSSPSNEDLVSAVISEGEIQSVISMTSSSPFSLTSSSPSLSQSSSLTVPPNLLPGAVTEPADAREAVLNETPSTSTFPQQNVAPIGPDHAMLNSDWAAPDYIIKVQGQQLPCHKAILFGRWPYFASAMKLGGAEFCSNTLELPDDTFHPKLMQALLQYFYSDQVQGIENDADCLVVLHHSLQFGFVDPDNEPQTGFEALMAHCRRPLAKPLSPTNCVEVLQSVLKYGNAHQQYKVRSFVARVLPEIMNNDKLATELEALGPAENMRILFEQFGRQTASPLRQRPVE
jgi:hypothetical protein